MNASKGQVLSRYMKRLFLMLAIFAVLPVKTVLACCSCEGTMRSMNSLVWKEAEDDFDDKLNSEFLRLERFLAHDLWNDSVLPVLMMATEQFTVVAMQQAMIIGMYIDAENQMAAQRLLQEIHAKIHKDYMPSVGMCQFGTAMKSLAASERRGEITSLVLNKRSMDRQLGNIDTSGMYGEDLDQQNRLYQFSRKFCNEKDRNNALKDVCSNLAWGPLSIDQRTQLNKDIDYFSLIDSPWTLSLDFTNTEIKKINSGTALRCRDVNGESHGSSTSTPNICNDDEENVFAMASNIFGHRLMPRVPPRLLENKPGFPLTAMQAAYLEMRSLIAKRSVAENTFDAIASMKAEGNRIPNPVTGAGPPTKPMSTRAFMEQLLQSLGVPSNDVLKLLGENPSYYAQMEVLTKKLYQTPDFYTNLYDTPANVERKTVALHAIRLMQKFDMLKSHLRSEANFSVLLELSIMDLQGEIEDQLKNMDVEAE